MLAAACVITAANGLLDSETTQDLIDRLHLITAIETVLRIYSSSE